MKVDFFIAGGPKCGTTALASYIDTHPKICFARPKEPWFFDTDLSLSSHVKHEGLVSKYHNEFFKHYDKGEHLLIGEGSPLYLFSSVAIDNILQYNPNARFIVMLRNPLDMVQSWHSQLCYNGPMHEPVTDFKEAWALQEQRSEGRDVPVRCAEPMQLQYFKVCSLGSQLERLYAKVNPENVLPILFDDMIADMRSIYLQTEFFLGIEDDGRTEFPRVNANKIMKKRWLRVLLRRLNQVKKTVGLNVSLGVGDKIRTLTDQCVSRESLEAHVLNEVRSTFLPEVELLEKVLKRDLSSWK